MQFGISGNVNGFSLICFLRISDSFDHPTVEQDIRHFRDWYWTLCQYLSAIDEGYQNEIQQLNSDPTKPLDMQSASMDVRQRSTKLYALLASSMKNRSLSIVRGTGQVTTMGLRLYGSWFWHSGQIHRVVDWHC